jgi:hypothetical protein
VRVANTVRAGMVPHIAGLRRKVPGLRPGRLSGRLRWTARHHPRG